MALILSMKNEINGVTSEYWKIARYNQEFPQALIMVNGYTSKEIRENNGEPVTTVVFDVKPDQTRTDLYEWLKLQSQFDGAQDDIKMVSAAKVDANAGDAV